MSNYCKKCKELGKKCGNYHIYIIDLKSKAGRDIVHEETSIARKFRDHEQIFPTISNKSLFNGKCIYIGITNQMIEDRYKEHKPANSSNTMRSNKYVREFASKRRAKAFLKDHFIHLNPLPFSGNEIALAEVFEQDYANVLRSLGYAVYSGKKST